MIDRQSSTETSSMMSSMTSQQLNRTLTSATYYDDTTANQRYYGYIPDLLHALAKLLDFEYEFTIVSDGSYGFRRTTGEWTGMIGELVAGVKDILDSILYVSNSGLRGIALSCDRQLALATVFGLP